MKKVICLLALTAFVMGCKNNSENQPEETAVVAMESMANYQSFGESITDKDVLSQEEMLLKYDQLKLGDTVALKFTSKVNSVCQAKGCWMRLDLGEHESFVKFKDYGFFMPKDIAGQEVIVEGKAFVEETSVEDLKHFAMDAGKPQEEIDAITEPELTYAFISSGVLIPEKQ
jgi:uncharacterized lipoprotein NlpE involved in copper resistance